MGLADRYIPFAGGKRLILGLTATSNSETCHELQSKLDIETTIKAESLRRRNLFLTISRDRNKLQGLLQFLTQNHIKKLKGTLIYSRSKYFSQIIHNVLTNSGFKAATYNSDVSHTDKV